MPKNEHVEFRVTDATGVTIVLTNPIFESWRIDQCVGTVRFTIEGIAEYANCEMSPQIEQTKRRLLDAKS